MRRHGQYTALTGTGLVGQFKEVGTPNKLTGSSGMGGEVYLLGYFARANYKLLDRYIINASARRDGISKFSAANRWANFFSGGLGWIISEEPWFNSETINLLKLRGSVGQTGNTNIPAGVTTDKWEVVNENGNTLEGLNTSRLYSIARYWSASTQMARFGACWSPKIPKPLGSAAVPATAKPPNPSGASLPARTMKTHRPASFRPMPIWTPSMDSIWGENSSSGSLPKELQGMAWSPPSAGRPSPPPPSAMP